MLEQVILRRSAIAYVYRENPALARDENLKFYDRVTASGVEIPEFAIQGGELVLVRRPVPVAGGLEIRVGAFGPTPQLRLLVSELLGDRPVDLVWETADLVWDAFGSVWGTKLGQPNLTEVTLEFSMPTPKGESRTFLTESVARIDAAALHHLGRDFEGFGLRLMSGPALTFGSGSQPALPASDINLRIETLLRDLSQLLLAITVKWPALIVPAEQLQLPSEIREQIPGPVLQANVKAEKPSHYLKQVYDFAVKNVVAFLRHAAE